MSGFLEKFLPEKTIPAFGKALGISIESANVLHLAPGNLFGGVERMLLAIAKFQGLFPTMIPSFGICFRGRLSEGLESFDKVPRILGSVSFKNPLSIYVARKRLFSFLLNNNFDHVICHGSWIHALFGKVVRKVGIPLVHMVHGIANSLSRYDRWSQAFPPDLVIANSLATIPTAKVLFPTARHEVAYPPIDICRNVGLGGFRSRYRSLYGVRADQKVVFAACRFETGKGLNLLIEALSLLKGKTNFVCWIAGAPQRKSDFKIKVFLEARIRALGIGDNIRWLGHLQDMAGHFAAADIYCQPNTLPESFGITFVEAQAVGCPVVTTAIGGALETVEFNCKNRLISKPCPEFYARALLEMLEQAEIKG
jgi:glycosyltransferase involved in cell wall biosynthesis